jgi:MipA family protein
MKHPWKAAAIIAVCLGWNCPASAQSFIEPDTVPKVIGLGVGMAPDYRGSDDYKAVLAPFAHYTFSGTNRYLQLSATELTFNVLNNAKYRFGPVLNYHPGRDDDVDDELVKRMQKIDGTVEAGVFGEIAWIAPNNPRNRFILGVTLLKDIGGEGDGFRARFNARYWQQLAPAVDFHIGGGIIYADSNYNSHYFSVTPQNVGTSGLPFFNASSGVNEYYITLGGLVYFNRNWLGVIGLRASKISGDAKDSPVVSLRGDSTQLIGGIGAGYMWR